MHEYWADVELEETLEFGSYEVTREEIVEFAGRYDPQTFHLDEEAAAESMFGGLVASGWHTAAMTMRLIVDNYLSESGAVGSPGVEDLRWPAPVRPGDTLRVRSVPIEREPWSEDLGLVKTETTTLNQDDVAVQEQTARVLYPRR